MPTTPNADEVELDLMTDRPHSGRTYDYLLGGTTNYPADRAAAAQFEALWPNARSAARSNRAFMHRAARHVAELGIDQFLDIGTGIPTEPNLHQVVQAIRPAAHVVYLDKDPIVLAHAAALLSGDPRGSVRFVHADARDPTAVLAADELRATLDRTRPVGISILSMLHFLDDEETRRLVHSLIAAVPAGSTLTLSHATVDNDTEGRFAAARAAYEARGIHTWPRSRGFFEELLADLEILDPGITYTHRWRPDATAAPVVGDEDLSVYAMVARLPAR